MTTFPKNFIGIGKNLNYTMDYLSRGCVRVNIPTLPYEAFDNTGSKLKPWSMLSLVESVRAFSFWTKDEQPGCRSSKKSYLDIDKVAKTNFIFIIGAKLTINPVFNDHLSPKFPLFMDQKLTYLGKSSKTLTYDLYYADTKDLYFSCDVTDVIVSSVNRSPSPYPDWWTEKYGDIGTNERPDYSVADVPLNNVLTSSVQVKYGDIDQYRHTNWGAYLKYSYENLSDQVTSNSYKYMRQSHMDKGLRECKLVYSGESNLGDVLTLQSWESEERTNENSVFFNILLGDAHCFHCNLKFY
ncbi:hypothetical protein ACF0H5_011929 [Mactra antiquata]